MKSLLARFPYIPRERILALQRYASTLQAPKVHSRRRKPRRRIVAFHPYDLDFLTDDVKLKGNVRIYRHANGRWYVRFKLNGKRLFLATGETDETRALLKISEVVKRAEQREAQSSSGKTFSDLCEEYTPYAVSNKAQSTIDKDKSRMKVLLAHFGKSKIAEISAKDVEQYMQKRSLKLKPASVNRELALLRHMLSKAVDWGYLDSNPAKKVKPFKEPPGRVRYLSDGERERLLNSCSGMLKTLVLTAMLTGMRKSELQDLTWDDVNLDEGLITLVKTKNNEIRRIPISKELLPVLRSLRDSMPFAHHVFSKPDGSPYGNWRTAFDNACIRAGIKDFRFHDLRHTFASYIAMCGHNAFTIQALTGHKTLSMVQRYTHLSNEYLRSAVDEIGEKVVKPEKTTIDDFAS